MREGRQRRARRSLTVALGGVASFVAASAPDVVQAVQRETYEDVARAAGRPSTDEGERVSVVVEYLPEQTSLSLLTRSARSEVKVDMSLRSAEEFLSATREVIEGGALVKGDVVRRVGRQLEIESREDGRTDRKTIALPTGPLAVDASLLLFFRPFIEAGMDARRVFMVDFSGRSITVELRRRGIESVSVPAGVFRCHALEVVVRFLLFRAVITYWVTADAPHFLVKHVGKRGPFARTTVTELTGWRAQ
jgi:hypothetical protein